MKQIIKAYNKWSKSLFFAFNFYALLFIVITITAGIGCSFPKYCSESPAAGNLGAGVNTAFDEYAPLPRPDGSLWFSATTSEYRNGIADEAVFTTQLTDGFYENRQIISENKFYTLKNSAYPTFYPNAYRGEYFFAGRGASGKSGDVDIYFALPPYSSFSPNPGVIPGINTDGWDSQPAVSPDGLMLVFSSDRPGGKGGLDLWISRRNSTHDAWQPPENFSLNSSFDDFTPFFSFDGELMFATKSISKGGNFDIVAVKTIENGQWGKIRVLPSPINTSADEISPATKGDSIFFASNRASGCGGYDLYAMRLCGPITAHGFIETRNSQTPLGGIVEISVNGIPKSAIPVDENGRFTTPLPSRSDILLRYRGSCFPAATEQHITTPCSENSAVSFNIRFLLPDSMVVFTFEEYTVPFFVSGYYQPNTTKNLDALRLQFAYNLLGNDDYSRYIEKPGDEYDEYARTVDSALLSAVNFISDRLQLMKESPCSTGDKYLEINVEGYADSRRILPQARYGGEDISDDELGIAISKGTQMTNVTLSTLRAYNTAQWLRDKLAQHPLYPAVKNNLRWFISGKGIDETARDDARKRRVSISISIADDGAKKGK